METVRKILLICLISIMSVMLYGAERKVYAYAYYEIDVELGYDNQAKYGRYIPVEIKIYSEEPFEGTISVQREIAGNSTQVNTYQVEVDEYDTTVIRTWMPLFEKNKEFLFILRNSAGEEVKRKVESVDVLGDDYTELFAGVIAENGNAKRLFNEINLGEYSNTAFPYILTRTFELEPSLINSEFEYTLDSLDIIILMDDAMKTLSGENVEYLLSWVEDGNILIVEYSSNIREELLEFYNKANLAKKEDDELRPGLWMTGIDYGQGHMSFLVANSDERDFYAFANSSKDIIGMVLCKACSLQDVNDIINYDMYYANYDDSYAVQYMLNTAVGKPVPDIKEYITIIVLYIVLVGPVLYFLLHKKNRFKHIIWVVIVLSLVFSYAIYKMGQNTRFTDMFIQYANIVNIEDDGVQEHTYICANVPYKDTYYMRLPSGYTVMPLLKMQNDTVVTTVDEETKDYIEFVYTDEDTKVILQNKIPFSREYIESSRNHNEIEDWQIDVDINYYDGLLNGVIINKSNKNYEQTALIMYGKIVLLGEIKSGESVMVDADNVVTLPYYPNDVAKRITGLEELTKGSDMNTNASYEELNGKAGILEYVVGKYFDKKNTRAVLVGFTDDGEAISRFDDRYETFGFTMIYKEVDINTSIGKLKYEPLDYTDVKNVDNNSTYDAYSNTTYGTWVRLQYKFEDADSLVRIIFEQGSASNSKKDDYYGTFEGVTYFYNYETQAYDEVDISKEYFYISEMEEYLLETENGYTLTVQYNVTTTGQHRYTEIKMPAVAVVRRIDYVESTEP